MFRDEALEQARQMIDAEESSRLKTMQLLLVSETLRKQQKYQIAKQMLKLAVSHSETIDKKYRQFFLPDIINALLLHGKVAEAENLATEINHPDAVSKTARLFSSYYARQGKDSLSDSWLPAISNPIDLKKTWLDRLIYLLETDSVETLLLAVSSIQPHDLQPGVIYDLATGLIKENDLIRARELTRWLYRYQKTNTPRYRYLEVLLYLKLSNAYLELAEQQKAKQHLELANAIAQKLKYPEGRSHAFYALAEAYAMRGNQDRVLMNLSLAREAVRFEPKLPDKIALVINLYHYYTQLDKFPVTGEFHEQAYWMRYRLYRVIYNEFRKAVRQIKAYPPITNYDSPKSYKANLILMATELLMANEEKQAARQMLEGIPECYRPLGLARLANLRIERGSEKEGLELMARSKKTCMWQLDNYPIKRSITLIELCKAYLQLNQPEQGMALVSKIPSGYFQVKALCMISDYWHQDEPGRQHLKTP
jgi:hypothetical protein